MQTSATIQELSKTNYIGRYAPSPTGDLHLGNLRTALIAWLHARLNNGQFLLRMEDLDTPRTVAGSADQILLDLEWLGIDWDGEVVYQSKRTELYQEALDALIKLGLSYPCFCSRKDVQLAASAPHGKVGVYPGTCADLSREQQIQKQQQKSPATRLRVNAQLASECGDFVIRRADQLFAYQLAVVVDDLEQSVTDIVRGEDLLDSTGRQQYLANTLEPTLVPMKYHHVPLLMNQFGKRMAKRDGSESAKQWRESNKTAEALVGKLAHSLDLVASNTPVSARKLLLIPGMLDNLHKKINFC